MNHNRFWTGAKMENNQVMMRLRLLLRFCGQSSKLISRKLPQTTKHNDKKKALQYVEKNHNLMSYRLQKAEGLLTVPATVDQEIFPVIVRLLLKSTILPTNRNQFKKTFLRWSKRMRKSKDNLKYENRISGIPQPVLSASLKAAASSNPRLQSGTEKQFISSIYQAKCLRAQANYVLNFKELQPKHGQRNLKKNTPLNDTGLYNKISIRAKVQKPGHVSRYFKMLQIFASTQKNTRFPIAIFAFLLNQIFFQKTAKKCSFIMMNQLCMQRNIVEYLKARR
ncbi:hypothetical protein VP01_2037g3 [Puccinia sorghi]|uniref:Uncharacterized protein n=1 Tax=Puccinia sorghi TaxID=27349 RepID=A0A0L6VB53_9BASI|nr:hypothetical protein VP01_2037g3 [Puccinia sorghi]